MNDTTVNALLDFTLAARDLLEREVSEQLEGIYGLLPNGSFADAKNYPALSQLPEARDTRQRLEQYIADQQAAGLKPKEAREKLAREAAFTWLNRLVAFKMMEGRKLVRQTITKGAESNAFKLWLAEDANAQDLALYNQGDLPANALGEGPRQRAYRHFLLWQCGQLAQEIKVLFDADNLPSRFFPRPNALKSLIDKLNDAALADAWVPGNEETIGWVYQGFSARELEEAFRQARVSGRKFEARDIPAVTQLFTVRWIVRFLVENTLGRLWVEMHPDSALATSLQYLVPFKAGKAARLKPVGEIRLLDPACGTMHFGLVAFDIFAEMYREEIAHAGQPGWPEKPSVVCADDIPAAILANNLYGIDIDIRAVQLSALTLYLRAKTMNPKAKLTESKLACAGIHMLDGNRLKAFLDESGLKGPIYRRILEALQQRLKDSEQLGSLLRLEQDIRALIERERERYEREGKAPDLFGWSKEQFDTEAGRQEFWETLEVQIEQALNLFAKAQAEKGHDQSVFVGEAVQGLRLLEIISNRYDAVVTNPPYMNKRKMNDRLKKLVTDAYPEGKDDLFAAFIQRCIELAADNGRVGMLTMHSFMFISSYEDLRKWARDRVAIETMAHAGPALFAVGNPGTLQTAAYVLRRAAEAKGRNESVGTYFRLVKEPDGDSKRVRFEQALANLKAGQPDPIVFHYRQADFDAIPGSPWVYWITPALRRLFETLPSLATVGEPVHGTCTYDNFRFVRFWWEAGTGNIHHAKSWTEFENTGKSYAPYMKGGDFCRWYGNQEFVLQLLAKGRAFKEFQAQKHDQLRGEEVIFKRGVTYSFLTSARFNARLSPGGFIFDVAGSSLFPSDIELVLAVFNSEFFAYALSLINPTVNCQVGDLIRLPIPKHSTKTLRDLVNQAVSLAKTESEWDETTYDFIAPPSWATGLDDAAKRVEQLAEVEKAINEEVYRLYGISDEDRVVIERELAEYQPAQDADDDTSENNDEAESEAESGPLTKQNLAYRWVSYAVGIVLGRFEPGKPNGLGRGNFDKNTAERLAQLADADGILVADEGHPDDLTANVWEALKVMLGETAAAEVVAALTENPSLQPATAPAALREWLDRKFFKAHIQQYRKRPVYWLLQSPAKRYGVWLFHERLTKDTLFRIRTEYVAPKQRMAARQIEEVQKKRAGATGRDLSRLDKELAALQDLAADLAEFDAKLKAVSDAGYIPRIDDGVLLNMCPLWELVPSWQKPLKEAWDKLAAGEYDWAHHAMDYWPERVKQKCKTNKSYAIAHGLA